MVQILTVVSSEAEATTLSLKGLKSVSRTAAVWPLKRGRASEALPTFSRGMTAKAPPPLASMFTEMNFELAFTRLVSQALREIFKLS